MNRPWTPRGMASRIARLVALACLALTPGLSLAQDHGQIYVHDITGPVRVFPLDADQLPPNTGPGPLPSRTFSGSALNQGGGIALDLEHNELIVASLLGNRLVTFPLTGGGSRTIEGSNTGIQRPFGVAYDPERDEIAVANQDSGTITFYDRAATGNAAPLRTVSGLSSPKHVVVVQGPGHDQIFVVSGGAVLVFNRAGAAVVGPVMTIATGLNVPQGIGYDAGADEIYVANSGGGGFVAVLGRSDGVLRRTIGGSNTELAFASAVAVDPVSKDIFVASFFPAAVKVFAAVSSAGNHNIAPIRRIQGTATGTFEPFFLAINPPPPGPASLVAAVLPASRSGRVGDVLTAFVTVINADPAHAALAVSIGIAPATPIAATLLYQETDPATNLPIGTANTPVNIPPGAGRTFVIAFTLSAPFEPREVQLRIVGTNTNVVTPIIGVNTILLSADVNPVTDIVALAATIGNTGYVDVPGVSGTGVFAVATSNLGAAALVRVEGNTGAVALPLVILVCQTNAVGDCLAPPAPFVDALVGANESPTFGFFVQGQGVVIADDAAVNRVFAVFTVGGVVRGKTSVAARTT